MLARSSDQRCGWWKQAAVLAHCFLGQPTQMMVGSRSWLSSGEIAADKAANTGGVYHAPCTSVPRWVLRTRMENMNSLGARIGGGWDRTEDQSSTTEDVVAHRSYSSIPVESPKRGSPVHGHVHGVEARAGAGGAAERRRRARGGGAGSRLGGAVRQAGGVTGRQCVARAVSVCTAGRGLTLSRETNGACPNN